MTARRIGLAFGPLVFALAALTAPPDGMAPGAWLVAGLVVWMAAWWMTEAVPLTVTALLPFVILPFAGVASAEETARSYYSPILFLLLGGAFIALAIERTGLHRRLSLAILRLIGTQGGQGRLLLAFMIAAALLSMVISNTSTTLIMMPMALAVLQGGLPPSSSDAIGHKEGLSGALPMGIAFAASIGGLGTIVGSPTNAISVGLIASITGTQISFAQWSLYGLPVVALGIPLAAWIVGKVQRISAHPFDLAAARAAIDTHARWTAPEGRLVPLVAITFLAWMTKPLVVPLLPAGAWTDGTIAIIAGIALFLLPDGTGRPLLVWREADRAPWGVIMMFGGSLALADGMQTSGLAEWLGTALLPLEALPIMLVVLAVVGLVVIVTEFASNVATASAMMPVVAALSIAMGVDPMMLALPAALAASLGFMLPAGTGPNAIAWATGRIRIERMVGAGFALDIAGMLLIVAVVWAITGFMA
ncbi:MAG: C4-dicarboxylate ABC transporter [Erythrobacter sp. SCN 62-14]|nr:MAG: C4-dicarboxylate ABC transporter [Erythrobacter sp. SCN 62-14]